VLDGPERTMLGLAAAVESASSHPLGRAILERAAADGIPLRPVKDAASSRRWSAESGSALDRRFTPPGWSHSPLTRSLISKEKKVIVNSCPRLSMGTAQ
jgi:hypothetical protein